MRSVHLHKDKSIFKVAELPANEFAESLGLAGAPKIKFLSKELAKQKKNADRSVVVAKQQALEEKEASDEDEEEEDVSDGDIHPSSDEEGASDEEEETLSKPIQVCLSINALFMLNLITPFVERRCTNQIRPNV